MTCPRWLVDFGVVGGRGDVDDFEDDFVGRAGEAGDRVEGLCLLVNVVDLQANRQQPLRGSCSGTEASGRPQTLQDAPGMAITGRVDDPTRKGEAVAREGVAQRP